MKFSAYCLDLQADWRANRKNSKGLFIVLSYRTVAYMHRMRELHPIPGIVFIPFIAIYKFLFDYVFGVYIPPEVRIGKGLVIYHGFGLVVHPAAVIGENCTLRHGVTIGSKDGSVNSVPVIGSNVSVGALAIIIGPLKVGDNAYIGAGAVVTQDVPSQSIAVGNPASIRAHSVPSGSYLQDLK